VCGSWTSLQGKGVLDGIKSQRGTGIIYMVTGWWPTHLNGKVDDKVPEHTNKDTWDTTLLCNGNQVVHIVKEALRMEDCLQVINERVYRKGRNISLSKSRKKLGSCSRSVHVKTLRRFPMTTYLKGKRKRQS